MHKPSAEKTGCPQPLEVKPFLFDGHCPHCASFDEEKFRANPHPSLFVLYGLITRHLKTFYRLFDGDLVLALVMCEIWHYNIGRYFDRTGTESAPTDLTDPEKRQKLLPPCNAYSISQVLGVPSETVRRKVRKLADKGWVLRSKDGELIAAREVEKVFSPAITVDAMREFVSAARHIIAMVEK